MNNWLFTSNILVQRYSHIKRMKWTVFFKHKTHICIRVLGYGINHGQPRIPTAGNEISDLIII